MKQSGYILWESTDPSHLVRGSGGQAAGAMIAPVPHRRHLLCVGAVEQVTITGFDLKSHRQCMQRWNAAADTMNRQCQTLGAGHCLRVPYEQLVLHPRLWMRRVLEFLELPWNETVLHHEQAINKPGGVSLSK